MKHLKIIFVLIIFAIVNTSFSFAQEIKDLTEYGSLVFKSGFEGSSQVSSHPTSNKRQIITGVDGDYNWQDLSNQLAKAELFYLVKDDSHKEYAEARVANGIGYDNSKGLLLETKKDDPLDSEQTRNEFWLYPDYQNTGVFSTQGFIRYKMKLDKNLNDTTWPSHWINFFETKQGLYPNRNYRFSTQLRKHINDTKAEWVFVRNNEQSGERFEIVNNEVPVPINEWMDIEIFWKKHDSKGRLFLKVNDNVVFDFIGQTQHPTNPQHTDFVSPMKNYRSREWHEGSQTSKIWYDDFELWSGFPEDKILSFDAPQNLTIGKTYSLSVKIESQSDRTIQLRLQNKNEDNKSYASLNFNVTKGIKTYTKELTVDSSAPLGNTYQWLSVVTTLNGNWDNRIDHKTIGNISCGNDEKNLSSNYWRLENKATGQWVRPLECSSDLRTELVVSPKSNDGNCTMFQFVNAADDHYFIINKATQGRIKFKNDSSLADDTVPVILADDTFNGWNPQWKLIDVGDGYYRIQNRVTGNWIRSQDCSGDVNTPITQVSKAYTGDCTMWKLIDTGESTTKQNDIVNNEGIKLYPNPATDIISFSNNSSIDRIIIYGLSGQKVLESDINENNTIDVSSLTNGLYFVKSYTENVLNKTNKLLISK